MTWVQQVQRNTSTQGRAIIFGSSPMQAIGAAQSGQSGGSASVLGDNVGMVAFADAI